MTITTPIAYLLIAAYLLLERWLRKGAQALRLSPGPSDRGSSYVLWIAGLLNFCVFLNSARTQSAQDCFGARLSHCRLAWHRTDAAWPWHPILSRKDAGRILHANAADL